MITVNVILEALYSATIWQPFILNHFSGQQYKSSLDNETNPFVEIICPTATKTITTLTTAQTTFSKWLTTSDFLKKEITEMYISKIFVLGFSPILPNHQDPFLR